MGATEWIAFGGLLFTILTVSGAGLWALFSRMGTNKEELKKDLIEVKAGFTSETDVIRQAAFTEYKEVRSEMNEKIQQAFLQLGEAPRAIREKVGQLELFVRDTYLPKPDYYREQNLLGESIRRMTEMFERRFLSFEKKLDEDRKSRDDA